MPTMQVSAGSRAAPPGCARVCATPVLIAVSTTIAVAVGALLVLGHGHRPG
jgi:hypothetical protein